MNTVLCNLYASFLDVLSKEYNVYCKPLSLFCIHFVSFILSDFLVIQITNSRVHLWREKNENTFLYFRHCMVHLLVTSAISFCSVCCNSCFPCSFCCTEQDISVFYYFSVMCRPIQYSQSCSLSTNLYRYMHQENINEIIGFFLLSFFFPNGTLKWEKNILGIDLKLN